MKGQLVRTASIPLFLSLVGCLVVPASVAREVQSVARTTVNPTTNVNPSFSLGRHLDVDADVDRNYHPWAAAAGVTTAAVAAGAKVGSIVLSIPPSCQTVVVRGVAYSECGSTWYMPQMQGASIVYVVVARPR
jgi:hypothetical protein